MLSLTSLDMHHMRVRIHPRLTAAVRFLMYRQLRNDRLADNKMAFKAYALRNASWSDAPDPRIGGASASAASQEAALDAVLNALRKALEQRLVDVESHLCAPGGDWRNLALYEEITSLL